MRKKEILKEWQEGERGKTDREIFVVRGGLVSVKSLIKENNFAAREEIGESESERRRGKKTSRQRGNEMVE